MSINSKECKESPFVVYPSVIAIDGPDGSGKSTLARTLYKRLTQIKGEGNVILADVTNVRGSAGQNRLQQLREVHGLGSRENVFYAAGVNRAYRDIVSPAVNSGKIVVIDRSELDLVRFAIEVNDPDLIKQRLNYIRSGQLTFGVAPGIRILLNSSPQDTWDNLKKRAFFTPYDPRSLSEVVARSEAQQKAEDAVLRVMPCPTVMDLNNPRKNAEALEQHLLEITDSILARLPLQSLQPLSS